MVIFAGSLGFFAGVTLASLANAQYSATYLPSNAPPTTEKGQTGTNKCGTGSNQTSMCQNAYINSVDDWCLWAPPTPGPGQTIGETEQIEVSWCLKDGYGTRLIPDGAISGAHFVITPDFVQVTGVGDLTRLNIPAGNDGGGELDPHGADGNGNPIGGLVFSSAFGQLEQIFEWTNFMANDQFCFRACKPGSDMAPTWCQHIYDEMGCEWNMPANYAPGVFEVCQGDSGEPMGVYGASTFHQGDAATPAAHPRPSSSQCTTITSVGNNVLVTSLPSSSGSSTASVASPTSSGIRGSTISSAAGRASASSAASSATSSPTATAASANSNGASSMGVSVAGLSASGMIALCVLCTVLGSMLAL
ncbi:hypothetical protein D9757_010127 [Collybiopsis confluens]|uniref:Macrofage activating glycoprotein n=1 Tax=Collybiopsis confluens TaxID=2823264 RepID=A0A8H5GSZ3_9AGAR|nr:hypothetical protein D9757_010127 [Collybiopsis confluens]